MRVSRRDQVILVGAVLVIVLVLVGAFLVWPQLSKMNSLDAEIDNARADVDLKRNLLAQRQQMKDSAAETNAKLLQLGTMVPDQPELPSLIIELQDAAYASGVKLSSVTPGTPTIPEGQQYTVIPLDLTVAGTWADSVDFLRRLNSMTRALRTAGFQAATLTDEEALSLPQYSVSTSVKIEAYTISTIATTTAPAPEAAPAPAQ